MMTDTWSPGLATHVVFASSAEWVCLWLYCVAGFVCCVACAVVLLALGRYRDSARSSARLRLLLGLAHDYTVSLEPRGGSVADTKPPV